MKTTNGNPFLAFLEAYGHFLDDWRRRYHLFSFGSSEAFKMKFREDNNNFVQQAKTTYSLPDEKVKRYLEFN